MVLFMGGMAVFIWLYIIAAGNRSLAFFQEGNLIFRWLKASGLTFYKKVICRIFESERHPEEKSLYKKMQQIYMGKDILQKWYRYQAEKYAWILLGLAIAVTVAWIGYFVENKNSFLQDYSLERPAYGANAESYELWAIREDGEREEINLILEAQIYSQEAAEKLFDQYSKVLQEHVKGNNASLQQITENLDFSSIDGWEGIQISWGSSNYQVIKEQGEVCREALETDCSMKLYLSMTHAQYHKTFEIPVTVLKQSQAGTESLQKYLQKQQENEKESAHISLPDSYQGEKVSYRFRSDTGKMAAVMFLILAISLLSVYKKREHLQGQWNQREQQLKMDYPEIISKLLILIRAGMPVRNAWCKMAEDYRIQKERSKKAGKKQSIRFVLEEMEYTIKEMEQGCGEGTAYIRFGKRCGQYPYIRLGSLLEQNLKKGNAGMIHLLENERTQAMEEGKRQIKARGELAGTRLMLPMMALFILVLIIILVPAFMSFSL